MLKKLKNSLRLKRLLVNTLETYYLFLDSIKIIISSLANLFLKGKLYDKELIFITGSDRFFFESLLQLVESVNMHEQKPKVVVYDLGLEEFQIKQLKETYDNLEYRKFNFSAYPNFFEERDEFGKLGAYAWKSAIISEIFYEKKTNIIWLDADFQHPPKYIKDFIEKSKKYEAIISSRFLDKSERYFNNDKFKKQINENQSYLYNKLCRIFLFRDITDYTSGYICVKKKFFKNYSLKGYYGDYFVDMIVNLKKKKINLIEIPFKDEIRASGISKTVVKVNIKYIYICFRYFLTLIKSFCKSKFN